MSTAILCSFSSEIEDMPRRKQGDLREVLSVLDRQARKRFSVFEVTDNIVIARTMTRLVNEGYIATNNSCGYPWTAYALTEKGRAAIAKATGESA
jgi:hypothetical protein